MPENIDAIYQSGEIVPFSGTFEVVGIRLNEAAQKHEVALRALKAGEAFATYEGMEVCWHLVVCSSASLRYSVLETPATPLL